VRPRPARGARPLLAGLLVLGVLAGCAPPPPGSIETLEAAARSRAERRERRLSACEARVVLRVSGRATGRLPAVSATARLAEPGRARLQARWLLGVLVDVSLARDTLTAWMPSERLGLRIGGVRDSLGLPDPANFVRRALAATWRAPHAAWRAAVPDSDGVALAWREAGGDWDLRLDRAGRPQRLRVAARGREVTVRYSGWSGAGADAAPSRIEIADGDGWLHVRADLEDLRPIARPRPSQFAVTLPDGVRPFDLDDLKRALAVHEAGR